MGEGGGVGGYGVKFLWKEGRMKSESGANVGIYQFFFSSKCDIQAERLVHGGNGNLQAEAYLPLEEKKKKKTYLHRRLRVPQS